MTTAYTSRQHKARMSPEPVADQAAWWELLDGLHADTPIMLSRPLVREESVARFGDNRWPLTPAIHQAHTQALSIDWLTTDSRLREELKVYAWVLLNYEPAEHDAAVTGYSRISVRTIARVVIVLRLFVSFLLDQGKHTICETTNDDLERYADFVAAAETSDEIRRDALAEVRRLWSHRQILPEKLRLPDQPPWGGLSPMDVLGIGARPMAENSIKRIAEHTMHGLLTWALRFTEHFADDILTAAAEYNRFAPYRGRGFRNGRKVVSGGLVARAEALVMELRRDGRPLPGQASDSGVELDFAHLGRLLDTRPWSVRESRVPDLLLASGLPIVGCAPVTGPVTGRFDGVPWRDIPIGYDDVGGLVDALTAACLIIVAYLSGMRPGEVLNLRRGCVHHDQATGLWTISGLTFKGERDDAGHKAEGTEREVPWVVVEPVAQAIGVMERLHASPLLFPTRLLDNRRPGREGAAVGLQRAGILISRFTTWVNAYCAERGRPDVITPDPVQDNITLSRFRRTLCWHIYRKPRGLVAAAIQYGHIATTTTLGYAGTAESGFPDELAFERFLARLDDLGDASRRLDAGEHVSGPSALVYRERVATGTQQFQGVVLTSGRQAMGLLGNASLQIYHGRGMTCVPQMGKQLCQLRRTPAGEDTPDLPECRRGCQCKAYTDADVIELRRRAAVLEEVVDDPLTPSLRLERERDELQRLVDIINEHDTTRTTGRLDEQDIA